jgi:hypothetical protein
VLEERLVGGRAALEERDAMDRRGVALVVAGVVVLDLVIVPGGDDRVRLADPEEVRVGVVEPVLLAYSASDWTSPSWLGPVVSWRGPS